jgi:hypothetical protein
LIITRARRRRQTLHRRSPSPPVCSADLAERCEISLEPGQIREPFPLVSDAGGDAVCSASSRAGAEPPVSEVSSRAFQATPGRFLRFPSASGDHDERQEDLATQDRTRRHHRRCRRRRPRTHHLDTRAPALNRPALSGHGCGPQSANGQAPQPTNWSTNRFE